MFSFASSFLSTPSARRATAHPVGQLFRRRISIHALREESDFTPSLLRSAFRLFLSTPSARRATSSLFSSSETSEFLSTPSARRATSLLSRLVSRLWQFLSTPSARRATRVESKSKMAKTYFYPRPPRGERLMCAVLWPSTSRFLSTPSARRATSPQRGKAGPRQISIHALREESDHLPRLRLHNRYDFYPRPPRGERHHPPGSGQPRKNFYPRPPRGERLLVCWAYSSTSSFLSTPSARRATYGNVLSISRSGFLSTPSARRATRLVVALHRLQHISIHALREESDILTSRSKAPHNNFYPRPPRGERPGVCD